MQELKERAKQHLEDILASVTPGRFSNYGSSSSSYGGGGSVDTQQLRGRLENAIRVMQTGLVERDTEVRRQEGGRGEGYRACKKGSQGRKGEVEAVLVQIRDAVLQRHNGVDSAATTGASSALPEGVSGWYPACVLRS